MGRDDIITHDTRFLRAETVGLKYEWHEYGAYIGIIPFVLFLIGSVCAVRRHWPLIITGLISLWIALGEWSYVNIWLFLHSFPIFDSFHVPSRFILGFIFAASLLSGCGLEYVERFILTLKLSKTVLICKLFVIAIVSFVVFDLWQVNSPAFFFNLQGAAESKKIEHTQFAQRYDSVNLNGISDTRSSMYPIFLNNSGILDGYEVVNVKKGDVRIESHPEYKGEVYLLRSNEDVIIKSFSPNKIVVDFTVKNTDILIVNQNYYTGWKVKKGLQTEQAEPFNGLISTRIEPGHYKIAFYFMPISFIIGLFVTVGFILFVTVMYIRRKPITSSRAV